MRKDLCRRLVALQITDLKVKKPLVQHSLLRRHFCFLVCTYLIELGLNHVADNQLSLV